MDNQEVKVIKRTKLQMLKEEQRRMRKEIKERTISYIVAALGLVAGLAWNEAIKSFITLIFPNPGNNDLLIKFGYAVVITIVIVIITVYLVRLTEEKPKT